MGFCELKEEILVRFAADCQGVLREEEIEKSLALLDGILEDMLDTDGVHAMNAGYAGAENADAFKHHKPIDPQIYRQNCQALEMYLAAKRIEGCSEKTLRQYRLILDKMFQAVEKPAMELSTANIREYLSTYQQQNRVSKVTIDNVRRIISGFFSWLEDEDYITKSPARRIHKVKSDQVIKEAFTDEHLERMRNVCHSMRDLAMIEFLASTGVRVGELVLLNRKDINFSERSCIVFGKGNKEREVYFDAKTKLHLEAYLAQREDTEEALFVSAREPHKRLTINGVEKCLHRIGKKCGLADVHPHKFRRTLATMAIDKGMPVEQVQTLLGHVRIDTTMHYAMVNQHNVKEAHRKYLG